MPELSIITPCFNSAPYVGKLIESVCAQTFEDWEHIIVDDGSADCTVATIEDYLKMDSRLSLIRQHNSGVCHARNRGFEQTSPTSKYVYFLDSDDVLEPEMLRVLIAHLEENPHAGLAYCDFTFMDANEEVLPTPPHRRMVPSRWGARWLPPGCAKTPFVAFYCLNPAPGSMAVIRRSVYERTSGWDETFGQHNEDVDLFMRICLIAEVHFVAQKLYRYRQHPQQSTANRGKFQPQLDKLYRKWDELDLKPEHRAIVGEAKRFRESVLPWAVGVLAAGEYLNRGRVFRAFRTFLGAIRLWGFIRLTRARGALKP